MSAEFMSVYLLIWPVIVAGVLAVLVRAFFKEMMAARREGRPII
ncbi:putative transporter small subunit [Aquamicrobium zhengzhouense]|nr:putative transporter small subunit [Aquamicrobium zhengzhouense]